MIRQSEIRVRDAVLSDDRRYRWFLERTWDSTLAPVLFVMLNPSTADAEKDDPTVRKCIALAERWGYGGAWIVNLYAARSAHPDALQVVKDPVGDENDAWIAKAAREARAASGAVVVAWGNSVHQAPGGEERAREVAEGLERSGPLHHIRMTRAGEPTHPLYAPVRDEPEPFDTDAYLAAGSGQ